MKFSLFSFERSVAANAALPVVKTGRTLREVMPTMTPEHMKAFRDVLELKGKMNRAYDAAVSDGYTADFRGTFGSANAELLTSKAVMRARNRTIAKDTPHGKAVVRTLADNVVGPEPFKLEMKVGKFDQEGEFTEEEETNRVIENSWNEFLKRENFTTRKTMSMMEALRVVEMANVTAGSSLCRIYRGYEFNPFGFAVDFNEEDRLQEAYMGRDDEGNEIRCSISYHPKYNFPVYYHILTRHPGDAFGYGNGRTQWFREKVSARDIIHFNNLRTRPEQDIGAPELDATTQPLWRIHQYEKSLTLASIASSAKPFWLQKKEANGFVIPDAMREQVANGGLSTPGLSDGGEAKEQGAAEPVTVIRPGERETFAPGYELKQADPKFPIEGAHEFRLDNLRDIAIGAGISYQHASGDFQNLGFIAGLMCQIPFQEHCKVRQNNMIDGGVDRIFAEWLRSAILVGYFDKLGVDLSIARLPELLQAAHFKGRGFPFVNPLVQAQALILLHTNGHLTRQQVQDALPTGMSFEKLLHELENEKKAFDEAGLNFDESEMTRPNADEGGDGKPPEKKKATNPLRAKARGGIDPTTLALIEQSVNGEH